jgi:hypothetical protein
MGCSPLPIEQRDIFAVTEVLEQAKDRSRLAKITNALNQHWQKKNAAKRDYMAGLLQPSSLEN